MLASGRPVWAESGDYNVVALAGRTGKPFLCTDDSIDVATFMVLREKSSLAPVLSNVEWTRINVGPGLTISQQLKQVRYCTMYFGSSGNVAAVLHDFGSAARVPNERGIASAEFLELAQKAKAAQTRAAVLPIAVANCEAEALREVLGPTRDRLQEVHVRAADGMVFRTERSLSHTPGDRSLFYPFMWDHEPVAVTLTYSVPPGVKLVIVECTVSAQGRTTAIRQIQ